MFFRNINQQRKISFPFLRKPNQTLPCSGVPETDSAFKYKAFISYSHQDENWGRWLHRSIEGYKVPKGLIGRETIYGAVPKRLFPVFRDREELPTASDLSEMIRDGLVNSSHLIVICSPNSAKSKWVNEEIITFKKLGKQNRIVCLIVSGEPYGDEKPELGLEECFPPAVKFVADENGDLTETPAEPIAADARPGKDGKNNSLMKVLSGLLGVGFDEIKQRDLARKNRRAAIMGACSLALAAVMGLLSIWAVANRNEAVAAKNEAEERLYRSQVLQAANFAKEKNYSSATEALLEAPERFRKFEWGYLLKKVNPQLTILEGINESIYSVAYSPDESILVTGAEDASARIWDSKSGRLLHTLKGHKDVIEAVAFSANGQRIATGSADNTIHIWDAQSGKDIAVLEGHEDEINSLVFDAKGDRLITTSFDKTARIWNLSDGKELAMLAGHDDFLEMAVFSPDGSEAATVTESRKARIWDASTGKLTKTIDEHLPPIHTVFNKTQPAAAPDESQTENTPDAPPSILEEFDAVLESEAFTPDEGRIVTVFEDGSARVWDQRNAPANKILEGHTGQIYTVTINPDSTRAITCSVDKSIRVWDIAHGAHVQSLEDLPSGVWSVAYSSDGEKIGIGLHDNRVQIRNTTDLELIAEMKQETIGWVYAVVFNRDGTQIASCSGSLGKVWSSADGQQLFELKGHTDEVTSIDFSPDGSLIATGSSDNTARIWDATKKGITLKTLQHDGAVNCVRFSKDGSQFVTGGLDKIGRVWDVTTGELLFKLEGHIEEITSADYSPDGTRIVTGSVDFTARIWDATNGQQLAVLEGHTDEINSVTYSRDGYRIMTGSRDRTARIWEAAPWEISEYPGDKSYNLMQRYNLWSHQRNRERNGRSN